MQSVCAVIVGHDSRAFLERALGSVERALRPTDELLLVDNLSTDGTADFVRARFPRCRVIESGENLGFGRACNLAVQDTAKELILLLNPDAWVDPSCVERLRQAMAADGTLGWAAPKLAYPDGSPQFIWGPTLGVFGEVLQRTRNRFERRRWAHVLLPRLLRLGGDPGWFSAAVGLLRRDAWLEVGGFDPGFFLYFEDADLSLRLRRAGWKLAEVESALAFHDKQGPSASSNRMVRYRESQLRYYRKHRPRWENRFLLRRVGRKAARMTEGATRASLLAVCERARRAFETGVLDVPETADPQARREAPETRETTETPTPPETPEKASRARLTSLY